MLWSSYWAEAGRDHEKLIILARPYTPYVEPVALAADVAGIQATIVVVQVVLIAAIARSRGPPVAVCRASAERAPVVVAASNRRKSGNIANNALLLTISWQPPARRTNIIGRVIFC